MPPSTRIRSIDVLRGAVMVLMALDHARVYGGVPTGGADIAIFLTRWVTHFCAPAFVFLAGTSAWLHGAAELGRGGQSRALFLRGLMLVVLELTVVKVSWTFSIDYSQFVLAGVIWMIGWCMVAMAGLIHLPIRAVAIIGLGLMAAHQIFQWLPSSWPWEFVYPAGRETPQPVVVLYTLLPWLGVMVAGYAFGPIAADPSRRSRWSRRMGLIAIAVFVIAATAVVMTGAGSGNPLPAVLQVLNQQKYPPSQLFLLMTLGPLLALIPAADRATGWAARVLETFGRVPLFYYLCHIPLLHVLALLVGQIRDGQIHPEWYATAPYTFLQPGDRWSLPLVYAVFFAAVALLYPLCRWYDGVRRRRRPAMIAAPPAS